MVMEAGQEGASFARKHPRTLGVLILLVLHLVFIGGPAILGSIAVPAKAGEFGSWLSLGDWTGLKHDAVPLLVGIVQLYYAIPAVLLALKLRHPAVAKGIVLGAIATFVLNMSGCAFFWWQLSKIG